MVTTPQRKSHPTVTFQHGATVYTFPVDEGVRIVQYDDNPAFVPLSGQQQAKSRPFHNAMEVKDISCDFAHQFELRWEQHTFVYDHLADNSGFDTRWGPLYLAPAENNPAAPTAAGTAWICGFEGVSSATNPNFNPKPYRFFQGTTNTAVFLGMVDEQPFAVGDVEMIRWTGTAMTATATMISGVGTANTGYYDVEEFQGKLVYLVDSNGAEQCYYTTNGSTVTAFTNHPGASVVIRQGSRLKALKGLLWCFAYDGAGVTAVVEQDSSTGANAWTTRTTSATALTGQLRDVETFVDPDGNARVFVLTETGLYYWDEANYYFVQMAVLSTEGRALIPARVLGEQALLIVQDEGKVQAYFQSRKPLDISPGGKQGMPSGKDLGPSADSHVCVAAGPTYLYGLFSGLDKAGAAFKPMILALDPSKITEDDPHEGWHYIWQKADTSIASAARFLFYDPISGDLVGGVQDAVSENTTLLRFKDIEVSPELQSTWDRVTSGAITLPYLDFGNAMLSTTVLDVFLQSAGLDANETVTIATRIDGSSGSYTNRAIVAADNTLAVIGDQAGAVTAFADYSGTVTGTVKVTSGTHGLATGQQIAITGTTNYNGTFIVTKIDANNFYITDTWVADDATGTWTTTNGLNVRNIQMKATLATSAATDTARVYSIVVGFTASWPIRSMYIIDVPVQGQRGANMPPPETLWANMDTIAALKTKGLLSFANVKNKSVMPIPQSVASVKINDLGNPIGNPRTGTRRMTFLES